MAPSQCSILSCREDIAGAEERVQRKTHLPPLAADFLFSTTAHLIPLQPLLSQSTVPRLRPPEPPSDSHTPCFPLLLRFSLQENSRMGQFTKRMGGGRDGAKLERGEGCSAGADEGGEGGGGDDHCCELVVVAFAGGKDEEKGEKEGEREMEPVKLSQAPPSSPSLLRRGALRC